MKRRDFLKNGAALFTMAGAYAFGVEIAREDGDKARTAILYGTRYGATRDTAGWIAEGMGGTVDRVIDSVSLRLSLGGPEPQ